MSRRYFSIQVNEMSQSPECLNTKLNELVETGMDFEVINIVRSNTVTTAYCFEMIDMAIPIYNPSNKKAPAKVKATTIKSCDCDSSCPPECACTVCHPKKSSKPKKGQ